MLKRSLMSSLECLLKYKHPSFIKMGSMASLEELEDEDEEEEDEVDEDEVWVDGGLGAGASPSSLATALKFLYTCTLS